MRRLLSLLLVSATALTIGCAADAEGDDDAASVADAVKTGALPEGCIPGAQLQPKVAALPAKKLDAWIADSTGAFDPKVQPKGKGPYVAFDLVAPGGDQIDPTRGMVALSQDAKPGAEPGFIPATAWSYCPRANVAGPGKQHVEGTIYVDRKKVALVGDQVVIRYQLKARPAAGAPAPSGGCGNVLLAGEDLAPGEKLTSCDKRATLAYQADGNAVVYGPNGALWASNTGGRTGGALVMQADGNLVAYSDGKPVWSSNTFGSTGARLIMQNDCNLVVYSAANQAIWSSDTRCN